MASLTRKLSSGNYSHQNSHTTPNTNKSNLGDKNNVKNESSTKSIPKLVRRHSITICESRSRTTRKLSNTSVSSTSSSSCDQPSSHQQPSGPFSMMMSQAGMQ